MGLFERSGAGGAEEGLYQEPYGGFVGGRAEQEADGNPDGYLDVNAFDEDDFGGMMDARTESAMRDMTRADSMIAKRKVERLEERTRADSMIAKRKVERLE